MTAPAGSTHAALTNRRFWRHFVEMVAEMGLAMFVPFVVLLPAFWAGRLSAGALFTLGHVLMLPAMVLAMLRRPAEYTCPA